MIYNLLNFFKNVWSYKSLLVEDRDWDYAFLLSMEKKKLERMIKCFESTPWFDHRDDVRWMKICVKLIDIASEEAGYKGEYVNVKNLNRFIRNATNHNMDIDVFKDCYRQVKALHLYNNIRSNYMFRWWD